MYPICPIYRNYPMYSVCPMYLSCPMCQMNAWQQIIRNSVHSGAGGITPTQGEAQNISLEVDGKKIEIMNSVSSNEEINKALQNPAQFQAFKNSPKQFLKSYNLDIDEDISKKLSNQLKGVNSIQELSHMGTAPYEAIVWAIVDAAYSFANTKFAVVI